MTHSLLSSLTTDRKFRFTLYKDLDDYTGSHGLFTVDELKSILSTSNESEHKQSVSLFNGTQFQSSNRQLQNALHTDLLIFDLDGKQYKYSPDEIKKKFSGQQFFAYETFSSDSTNNEFRWRIVIPLSLPVTATQYDHLWGWFVKELKLDCDHSTKRINAVFFLPEHETGYKPLFISNNKKTFNVTNFLKKNALALDISPTKELKKNEDLELDTPPLTTDTRLSAEQLKKSLSKTEICGYSLPEVPRGKKRFSIDEIKELMNNTGVGLKLAQLVGIDTLKCGIIKGKRSRSKSLQSLLPWHESDKKPSTGIMIKEKGDHVGKVLYRSFKDEDAEEPLFDLHYVYACQVLGKRIDKVKWTKSVSLVWMARALIDSGIIQPKAFPELKLPNDLTEGEEKLFKGLQKLSVARSVFEYYDEEVVPFTYSFSPVWCGMSRHTASKHYKSLLKRGLIKQTTLVTDNGTFINAVIFTHRKTVVAPYYEIPKVAQKKVSHQPPIERPQRPRNGKLRFKEQAMYMPQSARPT